MDNILNFDDYRYATHASTGQRIDERVYGTLGYDMSGYESDVDAWREKAGFNYGVVSSPVMFPTLQADGTTGMQKFPDRIVLHRDDDHTPLGIVSNTRFKYPQPWEVLEFFRHKVERLGYEMQTAITLKKGKRVVVIAKTPLTHRIGTADDIGAYLLLGTQYETGMASVAKWIEHRPSCVNVCDMLLSGGTVRIPHYTDFVASDIDRRLRINEEAWAVHCARADAYADRELVRTARQDYFRQVLKIQPTMQELVADQNEKEPQFRNEIRQIGRLELAYNEAPGQNTPTTRDTVWGAFNAVTWWADNQRRTRGDHTNRIDSALFGASASMKRRATALADEICSFEEAA